MATLDRNAQQTSKTIKMKTAAPPKIDKPPVKTVIRNRVAPGLFQDMVAAQPEKFREIRRMLGVNQQDFSRMAGLSVRNISDIETGKKRPTPQDLRRINELGRLRKNLAAIMKAAFISQWLQQPVDGFGGLKPIEVIERGEIDRIWRMIYHIQGGALS